jgi:hypothetical protein
MSQACLHPRITFEQWDHGCDPETGYRDAGEIVTCQQCGERFTYGEFGLEMKAIHDHLESLSTGTLLNAPLGVTIEVLDIQDGDLIYRCLPRKGPLQRAPLPVIIAHLRKGELCRVSPTGKL